MKIPTNSLDFAAPIAAFGLGIADAQNALNAVSIKLARTIAGLDVHAPKIETPSGRTYNLLELGLTPTFYHYSDAVFEMKIAVCMVEERSTSRAKSKTRRGLGVFRKGGPWMSSVDGNYSSRYQYSASSASRMRAKLVVLPTSSVLEERLRRQLADRQTKQLAEATTP